MFLIYNINMARHGATLSFYRLTPDQLATRRAVIGQLALRVRLHARKSGNVRTRAPRVLGAAARAQRARVNIALAKALMRKENTPNFCLNFGGG